ncbi:hypothetical protein [Geminicoccus flavidas]|uniref:hypothetical protein n=1 Tax=Geminicoccus flavidas TaxID=2506407 RepID=UPI00135B0577|nr:hypothetical protein [Geminicoccus flavidas]
MRTCTSRRNLLERVSTASTIGVAAVAAPAIAEPSPAPRHPDAELLRLRDALEQAWEAEEATYARNARPDFVQAIEDENQAAFEKVLAIAERMIDLPATTLEGLLAKATAIAWLKRDEPRFERIDYQDAWLDTWGCCSIANDLLMMRRYRA